MFYTRPVIRHGKYPIHLRLTEYREAARPAQNYVTIGLFVSRQLSVGNDRKSASAGNPAGKTNRRDRNARCPGICIAPSMAYGEVRKIGRPGSLSLGFVGGGHWSIPPGGHVNWIAQAAAASDRA